MHCGEDFARERLKPEYNRDDVVEQPDPETSTPATLEGCVVRVSDKVAYLGRDFEDAVTARIVEPSDLPQEVQKILGRSNREIIGSLVADIVARSTDTGAIAMGEEVRDALRAFRDFSVSHIYESEPVKRYFDHVDRAMKAMFERICEEVNKGSHPPTSQSTRDAETLRILAEFQKSAGQCYKAGTPPEQVALDFIGGMTDSFFIAAYNELFVPKSSI